MIAIASKNYSAIAANLAGHAARKCWNAAGHAARMCVNALRIARITPQRVVFFALVLLQQDGLAERLAPGYYFHLSTRFSELD